MRHLLLASMKGREFGWTTCQLGAAVLICINAAVAPVWAFYLLSFSVGLFIWPCIEEYCWALSALVVRALAQVVRGRRAATEIPHAGEAASAKTPNSDVVGQMAPESIDVLQPPQPRDCSTEPLVGISAEQVPDSIDVPLLAAPGDCATGALLGTSAAPSRRRRRKKVTGTTESQVPQADAGRGCAPDG